MQNTQQDVSTKIEEKDLQFFKNMSLIFALSTIGSLIVGFIPYINGIGSIVSIAGYGALAIGVLSISKKYPQLSSGEKVGWLLILITIIKFLSLLFDLLHPTPSTANVTTVSDSISLLASFQPYLAYLLIIAIVSGIITLIASYYFTEWFNLVFGRYNPTRTFFYYGIFDCIGTILVTFGTFSLINNIVTTYNNNGGTFSSQDFTSSLTSVLLIIIAGGICALAALILFIVSAFKIYNRVNDMAMGRIGPRYQSPYAYGSPYQQVYQGSPPPQYQQQNAPYSNQQVYPSNQQSVSNQFSNSNQSFGMSNTNQSGTGFCKNCGAALQSGSKFCQYCGSQI